MPQIRVKDAAVYLGVSDDTVRRWIERRAHKQPGRRGADGRRRLELAQLARRTPCLPADPSEIGRSARNRFVGIVTEIVADNVMSQVELQCGPHRVVSLMSSEAVRELGLELGSVAVAVVKATTVIVETPQGEHHEPHIAAVRRRSCSLRRRARPARGCASGVPRLPDAHADRDGGQPQGSITVFAAASLKTTFTELGRGVRSRAPGDRRSTFNFAGSCRPGHPDHRGRPGRRVRLRRREEHGQADRRRPRRRRAGRTSPPTCWRSPCRRATRPASRPSPTSPKPGVKIVVCAPEVPCGAATVEGRDGGGVTLTPVSEESSVTDVLGKVTSGEADAGLVYVTDVMAAGDEVEGIEFAESARRSTPTRSPP